MQSILSAYAEVIEKNAIEIKIAVKAQYFSAAMNRAGNVFARKIDIPGFRKGDNVPRQLIEKVVGIEQLYQHAIEDILVDVYKEAVKKSGYEPIDDPKEIDIIQVEDGKDFIFKAKVEIKPEVVLGEYKNLKMNKETATVTSEQVDEELKRIQNKHTQRLVLDEGAMVEYKDTVVFDYASLADDDALSDVKGKSCELVIGSGLFIPGFEEQLIGIQAGRETVVNVKVLVEGPNADKKWKNAEFRVRVKQIKREKAPALDDEFAKTIGHYDTMNDLKRDIRERLLAAAEQEIESAYRKAIVDKAVENAKVDIPEVIIKRRTEKLYQQFKQRSENRGKPLMDDAPNTIENGSVNFELIKRFAVNSVKTDLVIERIARTEGVEITADEFDSEIAKIAEEYKQSPSSIRKIIGQLGQEEFRQNLLNEKVIDFLVSSNP